MTAHVCSIVAPHLLDAIAVNGDDETRKLALNTLAHTNHVHTRRKERLGHGNQTSPQPHEIVVEGIVPDEVFEHAANSNSATAATQKLAQHSLDTRQKLGEDVNYDQGTPGLKPSSAMQRLIYDMQHAMRKDDKTDRTMAMLPGKLVRSEGDGPVEDEAVNQAYDNCAKVIDFFQQIFDYTFLDQQSVPIISSIHFEEGYQNALWVGDSFRQMIYGDGGPKLHNFTSCLDVIGHEMTHAVTEHICSLKYEGESGALNEHMSDVFGMMIQLWAEGKPTVQSDWLIGEGCLMPGVKGVALRNMKFPGTAYDDAKLGKDPQPGSYAEIDAYKSMHKYWASYDHGSVHAFSGVPNRAFVLAAEAFGGYCWEKAGRIWWTVLRMKRIQATCTFVQLSDATTSVARELFGEDAATIVRKAWSEVGIQAGSSTPVLPTRRNS